MSQKNRNKMHCDSPGVDGHFSPGLEIMGDSNSSDSSSSNKQRPNRDPMSHRIIEKRRRDRMNNCLSNLSKLIPNSYLKKGRGRIEKTEIIEMAIGYMKSMHGELRSARGMPTNKMQQADHPNLKQGVIPELKPKTETTSAKRVVDKEAYKQGFYDCMAETVRFVGAIDVTVLSDTGKNKLMQYLHCHWAQASYTGVPPPPPPVQEATDQPLNMSTKSNSFIHLQNARGLNGLDVLQSSSRMVTSSSQEGILESAPPMKAPRLLRALTMHDAHSSGVRADCSSSSGSRQQTTDGGSIASSTTHYPSSPSSTRSLSSHPGDSPPRVLSPLGSSLLSLASTGHSQSPGVPIFALHPSGLYYVPGTVSPINIDQDLMQALASSTGMQGSACHSVTITVNFCPTNNAAMHCNPVSINSTNPPVFPSPMKTA